MSEKDNRYKVLTDIDISRHNLLNVQKIEGSEHDDLGKTLEITTPSSSTASTGSIVIHPGFATSESDSEDIDISKSGSLYLYAGKNRDVEIDDGNFLEENVEEYSKTGRGITLSPDSNISIISNNGSITEKASENLRLLTGENLHWEIPDDNLEKVELYTQTLLDLSCQESSNTLNATLGICENVPGGWGPPGVSREFEKSYVKFQYDLSKFPTALLKAYTTGKYLNDSSTLEITSSHVPEIISSVSTFKDFASKKGISAATSETFFKAFLDKYFSPSSIRIGYNEEDTSHYAYDLKVELTAGEDSASGSQWNPLNKEYEWISTEHIDNLNVHKNLTFDGSELAFKSSDAISIDAPVIKIGTNENYKNTNLQIYSNSLKIDSDENISSIEVNEISVNKTSTLKGDTTLGDETTGITIGAPKSINLTSPEYSIGFSDTDSILLGTAGNLTLNVDTAKISASFTSEKSTSLKENTSIDGRLTIIGEESSITSKTINIGNTDTEEITIGNESVNLIEESYILTSSSNTVTETVTEKKSSNIKSYDLTIEELRIGKITKDAQGTETFKPTGDFKVEVNNDSSSVQSSTVTATNYVEASNLYVNKLSIYWDDNSNSVVFAKRA